jgi:hypothetical protein
MACTAAGVIDELLSRSTLSLADADLDCLGFALTEVFGGLAFLATNILDRRAAAGAVFGGARFGAGFEDGVDNDEGNSDFRLRFEVGFGVASRSTCCVDVLSSA